MLSLDLRCAIIIEIIWVSIMHWVMILEQIRIKEQGMHNFMDQSTNIVLIISGIVINIMLIDNCISNQRPSIGRFYVIKEI
jgi:EamA domain-containing membrane protein RarD